MSVLYIRDEHGNLVPVPTINTGLSEPTMEYVASELIENQKSVCVLDDTGASTDAEDNSAYFDKEYILVEKDTYKLDKEAMFSIPGKHLTGNGSVAWKDWDTQPQGWKDSEDATMLSSKLKVRYADDPVYLSMKLPSEANFTSDNVLRAGMREADGSGKYTMMNNIGAIMPVDYTQLPDEVVICIGNLSVYTLSRELNARWKLHTKESVPLGQAMYYLPWKTSGDAHAHIDPSKITIYDNYARFALTRADFAPDDTVAGSLAKTLHFWGEHKNLDLKNTRAVITFFEVWTETPEAVGNLYTSSGCDQKSADKKSIKQNFWGRNVLLQTSKTVITGHTISDALYDELRDTPSDPRCVYADYAQSFSNQDDVNKSISGHNLDTDAHPDIRKEIAGQLGDVKSKVRQMSEVIQPMEVLVPGINLNEGVYEYGYFKDDGSERGADYPAEATQMFRSANYIKVEGGRTIAVYYDAAEWNKNDQGIRVMVVEYDSDNNPIKATNVSTFVANKDGFALNANTAYVRIGFHKWADITTPLTDIKIALYYIEDAVLEFVEYGFGSEAVYGVPGDRVYLTSPSGNTFILSVSDDGTLTATPTA